METFVKSSYKKLFHTLNNELKLDVKKEKLLPKLRLLIFSFALVHLVTIIVLLLSIDLTASDNPELRIYQHLKWRLITTWFNLLMIIYFPLCIYCEWREINNQTNGTVWQTLNNVRNVVFTSILLPTTTFADLFFWRLYNKNSDFLFPRGTHEMVPFWTQHSMHTISLVVIFLDLVLTPRQRPRSLVPSLAIMLTFVSSYLAMCVHSLLQGVYIYPFLRNLSNVKRVALVIYILVEHGAYYFGQWLVIDLIWSRKTSNNHQEIKKIV